ncbi:MAG TPA: hypothetical protein VLZ29_08545 [Sulfurimonas sp.]|uniref:hypothetical protein n=1 Tax=Sulfurimonas sp. TaxID=2022749 RepID=UPI002B544F1D|nr:hypothetical protein [Sulfurimonas sp.]HUH43153.1 hypothetical protein [Sulfurimonas sp.]
MAFKESSKKHLRTCECLINNLDQYNEDSKYVLSNILYLTGYTIETILKYRLFLNISYARDKAIKDVNQNGITWNVVKTHDLRNLLRHLRCQENMLIFNDLQQNNYFKSWDKDYHEIARYENNNMKNKQKEILDFFELSKELFQKMTY